MNEIKWRMIVLVANKFSIHCFILIINTTANIVEKSFLSMFQPSADAIVNAKSN